LSIAGSDREQILIAKCDLRQIDETRESWPFFRDRRIDAYGSLQARFIDSPDGASSDRSVSNQSHDRSK
jgi:N-carbamoylputrescine amidase